MSSEYAYIGMNRFGLGADNKSVNTLNANSDLPVVQSWLINQLSEYKLPAYKWTSNKAMRSHVELRKQRDNTGNNESKQQAYTKTRRAFINEVRQMAEQTAVHNLNHLQPMQARLLDFFSNHFSVSRNNLPMTMLAPTLEAEAIGPNLHMRFSDILVAVTKHPAMLIYLNNEASIGPNSNLGKKRKGKKARSGLNENLSREILELHTLGVNGGYTQADVTELAKAITGWSVASVRRGEEPGFVFRAQAHELGDRFILGKKYKQMPLRERVQTGYLVLKDLAKQKATAKHLSTKLVRHFIADSPPMTIVNAMVEKWLNTDGHIPSVMGAMIMHKDSWNKNQNKYKTPREFVVSSMRAFNVKKSAPRLYQTLELMGQGFFNSGSPAGYADVEDAWLSTSALNTRIEWASHFASFLAKRKQLDPVSAAKTALGPFLTSATLNAIKRAESKEMALAVMLLSPEFQRR
ncbi:DUF1800 domain-containing protein [Glaciecola petra]|uniref:DUF1800 domain-containing protein n=1 Tax=Glaciecola petra TaxID=3075602 RepID=A0ABU2ZWD9_9ALTE|nr:DUF1800 domain-containing protein [Aestuariibacter sp. P117]MDT0595894.1 DUF1800 domain-containing protein [Aestuariibacter sp. P117]